MKHFRARCRNEDGAVLLIALGFLTFIGVVGAVLVNYASTSIRVTITERAVRTREYAADGVAEAAVNKFRDPANAGSANSNNCLATTINGLALRADCSDGGSSGANVTFTICPQTSPPPCTSDILLVAKANYNKTVTPWAPSVEYWSVRR